MPVTYTDRQMLKQEEAGALNTYSSGGNSVAAPYPTVALAHSDSYSSGVKSADDGMASTATSETALHISLPAVPASYGGSGATRAFQVNRITYTPVTGSITNDNTNFATITVSYRLASTGGTLTTLGTLSTTITALGASIAQWQEAAFTLTAANITIPSGGATLTFSIAKSGSGVVVRGGTITIDGEWV